MDVSKDYYNVLSTSPKAPTKVIKATHKALLTIFHPDKFPGCAKYAHTMTIAIQEAYQVLSNERSRADYDKKLLQQSNKRQAAELFSKRQEEQKYKEMQKEYKKIQEEKLKAIARAKKAELEKRDAEMRVNRKVEQKLKAIAIARAEKAESEKKEAEDRARKAENLEHAYFFKLTQQNKKEEEIRKKEEEIRKKEEITKSFMKRFLFALPLFLFSLCALATLILVSFAPSTDSPIEYGICGALIYVFYKFARTTFCILTNNGR